jgi:hypothetical protein
MRRMWFVEEGGELTETIVSRPAGLRPPRGTGSVVDQRVSTVTSNGESNIATGEITGSSIGTLSP